MGFGGGEGGGVCFGVVFGGYVYERQREKKVSEQKNALHLKIGGNNKELSHPWMCTRPIRS